MDMVCNCLCYRSNCRQQIAAPARRRVPTFARFRFPTSDYKKNQVLVRSWRECREEGVKHNQRLDDDKDFECKLQ